MARSKETTHKIMSKVHSRDTKIEIVLRKALWQQGLRYRKNYDKLPGKPDIAITKYKLAIFCDSEFFHGKDWDNLKVKLEKGNNSEYWIKKIQRNIERDMEINKELDAMEWTVLRFWGKEILNNVDECVKAVEDTILNICMNHIIDQNQEDEQI